MTEDDIIVYVRKVYGSIEAAAVVQGNQVAVMRAPIREDEGDRRSDIAELTARAYDAAMGIVRASPRLASTTIDTTSAPTILIEQDIERQTVKRLAAIHRCAPADIDAALRRLKNDIRYGPSQSASAAQKLTPDGERKFEELRQHYATRIGAVPLVDAILAELKK